MKKICVNTIIKNEDKWLWFAASSVVDYVEKIIIWDTGSDDRSKDIADELKNKYPNKIIFREVGSVDETSFSEMRQKMLDESNCDWILVLDGDEIWWNDSLKKIIGEIESDKYDAIITPFINCVGDIFHYQPESAGRYKIAGKMGNFTIRAFRKNIKGLKVSDIYGKEGYIDASGKFIQESLNVRKTFVNAPFLHMTHLIRSSKGSDVMQRKNKFKHEIGKNFDSDFYYPEVLFRERPAFIESPWSVASTNYKLRAYLETPAKKFKRNLITGGVGY